MRSAPRVAVGLRPASAPWPGCGAVAGRALGSCSMLPGTRWTVVGLFQLN